MKTQPHGQPNHFNAYVLDQDDHCTGFGKHNRIISMHLNETGNYEVREDTLWNLPASTCEQRQAEIRRVWGTPEDSQFSLPSGAKLKPLPPSRDESSIWFEYEVGL